MQRRSFILAAALAASALGAAKGETNVTQTTGYIEVDGLDIYYEDHGTDREHPPVILLHGALMAIDTAFAADLLPRLAQEHRVIAIEAQGHGHTADRAEPLSEVQLASDTAGVLDRLGIAQADFVAHSLGGIAAVGVALRRPDLVRSVTVLGRHFTPDGMLPELVQMQTEPGHMPSPELAAILPTPEEFGAWAAHYQQVAPDPAAFQALAMKVGMLTATWPGWTPEQLRSLHAPALIVIGDRDFVRPAHAAEVAAMLPDAQLAVLPATTHMSMLRRGDWLVPMLQQRWAGLA